MLFEKREDSEMSTRCDLFDCMLLGSLSRWSLYNSNQHRIHASFDQRMLVTVCI